MYTSITLFTLLGYTGSDVSLAETIPVQQSTGTVNLSDWDFSRSGNDVTIKKYTGSDKDVVIPLSGDFNCTNVYITKDALRSAAVSANNAGGTLSTTHNDTSRQGLVSNNSGDSTPNDTTVDYSETFKDLSKVTSIDLREWNVVAANGAKGADKKGDSNNSATGASGGDGAIGFGNGTTYNGKIDSSLKPENLTGKNLKLYQEYVGTTDKTNMFCPITLNNLSLTKIVGFNPYELKENIAVLRDTNSGNDITNANLNSVKITAVNSATGEQFSTVANNLDQVTQKAGNYDTTYEFNNTKIQTDLYVVANQTAITLDQTAITKYVDDTYGKTELIANIKKLTDKSGTDTTSSNKNSVVIKAYTHGTTHDSTTEKSLDQLTKTAGIYDVVYTYNGVNATLTLTVEKNQTALEVKDSTIAYGSSWKAADNIVKATDKTGKDIKSEVAKKATGTMTTSKVGKYEITYTNDSITKKATVTVSPQQQYTVTFKSSTGGTLSGATSTKVIKGKKVTAIPTVKASSGYTFAGWYDSNNKKVDPKSITINGNTTFTAKFTKSTTPVKKIAMYRLYNPNSGEHFYTANTKERDNIKKAGWKYEGIGWYAPDKGTSVYRLYNPKAGDHHYTTSTKERDNLKKADWKYEGICWYSGGNKKVYRQYNPNAKSGAHNYTTNKSENDHLVKVGWRAEGIGWYAQ